MSRFPRRDAMNRTPPGCDESFPPPRDAMNRCLSIQHRRSYSVFKGVLFYASSCYYTGLNDIYEVNYSMYNGLVSTDDTIAVSRDSYWNFAFGVKFAISNLWKRRDKRIDDVFFTKYSKLCIKFHIRI